MTALYEERAFSLAGNDNTSETQTGSYPTSAPAQMTGTGYGTPVVTYIDFHRNTGGGVYAQHHLNWHVPDDCDVSAGITCRISGVISSATPPASGEGVVFEISGVCFRQGDNVSERFGSVVELAVVDLYGAGVDAQKDFWMTGESGIITIANLTVGRTAVIKIDRAPDHADDDYAELIGVTKVVIKYRRVPV